MEVKVIPDQQSTKELKKNFAEKLKKISDSADKEAQKTIAKGLDIASDITYFPEKFSTYLLDLKLTTNLPVSLLPASLFDKPVFKGRGDFFHRLASELISFGLAYQRVYLKPVALYEITSLFHKHRPWWKCDIQDVEKALKILKNESIVQESKDGYTFEPFSVSTEIRTFLAAITDGVSEHGEISFTLIEQLLAWEADRISAALKILMNNKICLIDDKKQLVYFPGFKK